MPRKQKSDFEYLAQAVYLLKMKIYKEIGAKKAVEWLSKQLNRL